MKITNSPLQNMIVVDRDNYRVTHYKRSRLRSKYVRITSYKCAVGAIGFETPRGMYYIEAKSKNPDWKMPESKWVPKEDWGKIIPGGHPDNPLKAAFLAIYDGVGIHGTAHVDSLGTKASHGCIRVRPEHALQLYDRIPVGTPVYIF